MAVHVNWVVGDTESWQGQATLRNGVTPVDLTGATGTWTMTNRATGVVKINGASVTIPGANADDGYYQYDWATADVDTAGDYDVRVTFTRGGRTISAVKLIFHIEVR